MSNERKFQVGDVVKYGGIKYTVTGFDQDGSYVKCESKKWLIVVPLIDIELVTPVEDR